MLSDHRLTLGDNTIRPKSVSKSMGIYRQYHSGATRYVFFTEMTLAEKMRFLVSSARKVKD